MITLISISPTVNEYYLAEIAVDTVSELPNDGTVTYNEATFYISAGSKAIATDTTKKYIMSSDYTWTEYTDAQTQVNVNVDLPDVYSEAEVDALLAPMQADITKTNAALPDLVDESAKNRLRLSGSDVTGYGIKCTFDYEAGTITLDGVNADKKCTGSFNIQIADSRVLGLESGQVYDFSCAGYTTSNDTIGLYVYTSGATPLSQFDTYTNTEAAWNTAWEQSNGFRLFIRSGTYVDNVTLKPMICKKELWDISHDFVPYSLTNSEITDVIVEDIDGGHKNTLILTDTSIQTSATVTCTYNGDGTYTINGTATAAGYFYLARTSSNPVFKAGSVITGCTGGGSNTYKLAIAGTTLYQYGDPLELTSDVSGSLIFSFASGSAFNNMLLKPMVCTKAKYNISPAFVQYCPTLAELYQMFLSGNRSVPVQSIRTENSEISEIEPETEEITDEFGGDRR